MTSRPAEQEQEQEQEQEHAVSAIILAGGQSRRFNGEDKGLIQYKGKAMIASVIEQLDPCIKDIIISANRNQAQYRQFNVPVIGDQEGNAMQGPLAGIVSGACVAQHAWLLICACDMPELPKDLFYRLALSRAQWPDKHIFVAHDGVQVQPLCMLLHRPAVASIQCSLERGQRSVKQWLEQQDYKIINFADEAAAFSNINNEEQRRSLEKTR
jgi:molybdopterin-guanine dinucleotide biosynthesis protein A